MDYGTLYTEVTQKYWNLWAVAKKTASKPLKRSEYFNNACKAVFEKHGSYFGIKSWRELRGIVSKMIQDERKRGKNTISLKQTPKTPLPEPITKKVPKPEQYQLNLSYSY